MSKKPRKTAKTQGQLAEMLHVSRRTIARWLKRPDCPGERADGGFDVAAWKAFAEQLSAARAPSGSAAERARYIRLKGEKLQAQLANLRSQWVPINSVIRDAADLKAAITKIVQQIHESAGQLVGMTTPDAEKHLLSMEDRVLQELHAIGIETK